MSRKVLRFTLSESGVDWALRELERYKRTLAGRAARLRDRVAERLAETAQSGFAGAVLDDLLQGGARPAEVSVSITQKENVALVIARGEDAVWVEFGAGVYHNGAAGSSPHPSGAELGLVIGKYGRENGKKEVWGYYQGGEVRLTRGTPAAMPMYHAMRIVCAELSEIAEEVWR